jgi:hypothetical protein
MPVRGGHAVHHHMNAVAAKDEEQKKSLSATASAKSLLSTLSSPSIFSRNRSPKSDNVNFDDLPNAKETDSKKPHLNKLKLVTKKVVTSNRMNVLSDSEAAKKKKRERADLTIYALFMFFFTLNTIDGLGDQAGYKYTETITSTLKLSEFQEIVTYEALSDWLDVSV